MKELAWVNGVVSEIGEAKISCLDRGHIFGDGVYEVIRVYGGKPFAQKEHLDRLFRSLEAIKISKPMGQSELAFLLTELVMDSGIMEAQIYLQVTRGIAPRTHAFPPAHIKPSLVVFVSKVEPLDLALRDKGGKAVTVPDDRWKHCYIKSINLLPNVLAKETAKCSGVHEAIFVREGDIVSEGSSSNVFVVVEGKLITPPTDGRILAGITRGIFIKLAREMGFEVREEELALAKLRSADEVFFTGTLSEFLPIVELDGKLICNGVVGPVGQKLYAAYRKLCLQ
ncbi:MAG TPA: D-amino acid aminotransferase [Verrucomicrobiae bacterium]|nr:D-amino acid aminotransferase [Verrucomicrobiae bacterium]